MSNVVTSTPFPVIRLMPSGKWRYFATLERGDVKKGWNWSIRYKVLSSLHPAAASTVDDDFSSTKFSSSVVEYENTNGIIIWKEVTLSAQRGEKGGATIAAVRVRNDRDERLEITVRLDFAPRGVIADHG